MQDDDDGGAAGPTTENAGPKIKMNRIGRKGKKPAAGAAGDAKKAGGAAAGLDDYKPEKKSGAFSE